jgi:hypothetical protein
MRINLNNIIIASLFLLFSINTSGQKQPFLTIAINGSPQNLKDLEAIVESTENLNKKYQKILLERYERIPKNPDEYVLLKTSSILIKDFRIPKNNPLLNKSSCNIVPKGYSGENIKEIMQEITLKIDKFDKETTWIVYDPSGSCENSDDFELILNLKVLVEDAFVKLSKEGKKIILIYNSFQESDINISLIEPYIKDDNYDYPLPSCLNTEERIYYYPFKWSIDKLCISEMEIKLIFFDKNKSIIKFYEYKDGAQGPDDISYYFDIQEKHICFFVTCELLTEIMYKAYGYKDKIQLWSDTKAFAYFQLQIKYFNKTISSDLYKYYVDCHWESNTACICK